MLSLTGKWQLTILAAVLLSLPSSCSSPEPPSTGRMPHREGLELGSFQVRQASGISSEEVQVLLGQTLQGHTLELQETFDHEPPVESMLNREESLGNPFLLRISGIDKGRAQLRIALLDKRAYVHGNAEESLIALTGSFSAQDFNRKGIESKSEPFFDWNTFPTVLPVTWQARGMRDGQPWNATLEQLAVRRWWADIAFEPDPADWPERINIYLNPILDAVQAQDDVDQSPAAEFLEEHLGEMPTVLQDEILMSFSKGADGQFRLQGPAPATLLAAADLKTKVSEDYARINRLNFLRLDQPGLAEAWRQVCPFTDDKWPPGATATYNLKSQLPDDELAIPVDLQFLISGNSSSGSYYRQTERAANLRFIGRYHSIGALERRHWRFGEFEEFTAGGLADREARLLLTAINSAQGLRLDSGLPRAIQEQLVQYFPLEFQHSGFDVANWISTVQPGLYRPDSRENLTLILGGDAAQVDVHYEGPALEIAMPDGAVALFTEMATDCVALDFNTAVDIPAQAEQWPAKDSPAIVQLTWTIRGSYLDQPFEIVATQTSWISL